MQKVANVPLDLASVQTLVKSLAAAREVEQDLMDGTAWRIAKQQIPESAAFKTFPCGICPVSPFFLISCDTLQNAVACDCTDTNQS